MQLASDVLLGGMNFPVFLDDRQKMPRARCKRVEEASLRAAFRKCT